MFHIIHERELGEIFTVTVRVSRKRRLRKPMDGFGHLSKLTAGCLKASYGVRQPRSLLVVSPVARAAVLRSVDHWTLIYPKLKNVVDDYQVHLS